MEISFIREIFVSKVSSIKEIFVVKVSLIKETVAFFVCLPTATLTYGFCATPAGLRHACRVVDAIPQVRFRSHGVHIDGDAYAALTLAGTARRRCVGARPRFSATPGNRLAIARPRWGRIPPPVALPVVVRRGAPPFLLTDCGA